MTESRMHILQEKYRPISRKTRVRWFLRDDNGQIQGRGTSAGFRSKKDASDWINSHGDRLEWRAGFMFKLKGQTNHSDICDANGVGAKP